MPTSTTGSPSIPPHHRPTLKTPGVNDMNDKSFDTENPHLRAALMGAAGVSAAAFLAACGSAGKNPTSGGGGTGTAAAKTAAAAQDMSDTEKVINWSNWPAYIDVDDKTKARPTLEAFTKATGIKVNYTEDYNDNDEFYAKVRPLLEATSDTGRDVWCSTDWMVARLIRNGYVQKLDMANIPNHVYLQDSLKQVTFDPGRQYSLPWQSGFAGIAYNPKATGGKKVESVDQLLTDPSLKGKVTLLTEMRDTVGLVLMAMGKKIESFTDADFDAAMAELQKAKDAGQIKGFTGNDYTIPQTGCTLWSDNFVIPALAKHKKNAERLINYYYDPKVMAQVVEYVNYISVVKGAQAILAKQDPSVSSNELIFPSAETLSRAHVFRGLTAEEETRYNKKF